MDLKGLEPLTPTMPLWCSPKLSYRPIVVWRATHSLRITGATGAAYWVRRRSSRTSSACALVAGAVPGLHCLRLTATMAYYFRSLLLARAWVVKVTHILLVRRGIVKAVFGRIRAVYRRGLRRRRATTKIAPALPVFAD